jgi:hypothetical protein
MATYEDEIGQALGQAIADTENEIFSEAFGDKEPVLDDSGDRTHEEMGEGLEGQQEPPDEDDDDDESEESEGEEEEGEPEEGEGEEGEEAEAEEEEESEPEEAETEAKAEAPKAETKPDGRVPAGRLREQTERATRAEERINALTAEREAERQRYERDIGDLRRQFDGVLQTMQGRQPTPQTPQPSQPEPDTPPDQFENPQGYTQWLIRRQDRANAELKQQLGVMRFQNSVDIARAMHGDKFTRAWEAVNKLDSRNPDELAQAQRIFNAPDPGNELMKWHARQETLRVVGDDPEKYRASVLDDLKKDPEFRKQLLEELRAEATGRDERRPARHVTRLPKSLNGATGQGSNNREAVDPDLYDNSEKAVWDSAWR